MYIIISYKCNWIVHHLMLFSILYHLSQIKRKSCETKKCKYYYSSDFHAINDVDAQCWSVHFSKSVWSSWINSNGTFWRIKNECIAHVKPYEFMYEQLSSWVDTYISSYLDFLLLPLSHWLNIHSFHSRQFILSLSRFFENCSFAVNIKTSWAFRIFLLWSRFYWICIKFSQTTNSCSTY